MRILRVDELPWARIPETQRRVFVRVDFNVPLKGDKVLDDYRIRQAIPTLRYLMEQKCIVVCASHLGRPKGPDPKLSLLPIAEKLAELMDHDVVFSEETFGDGTRKLVQEARGGKSLLVLENLRFHPEEEKNDSEFAEKIFQYTDIYVNDAFGASHRAHASIEAITHFAKHKAMGLLLAREWEVLNEVLHHPKTPQMAVLGGAKISDKIQVITQLMSKCSDLFVGGRMGNTFLAAQGVKLGSTNVEEESIPLAKRIMADAKAKRIAMHFPVDAWAAETKEASEAKIVSVSSVPSSLALFDIGPKTLEAWSAELENAKSVVWNGPMGVFENPVFANGTLGLADFLVKVKDRIQTVAGGGETVAAITQRGALQELYHVSTGGGAMLEFLEGQALPGFESLKLRDREIEAMAVQ